MSILIVNSVVSLMKLSYFASFKGGIQKILRIKVSGLVMKITGKTVIIYYNII